MRSLRIQLLLSHLVLVLLMASVMGSVIYSLRAIPQTFSKGRIGNAHAAKGAEYIMSALTQQRLSLWLLLAGAQHDAATTNAESWKEYEDGLSQVHSQGVDDTVTASALQLEESAATYHQMVGDLMTANELTLQPTTEYAVRNVLEPRIQQLQRLTTDLESTANDASARDSADARKASDAIIHRSVWVTLIGVALAVVLGLRLVRTAVFPLKELVSQAERIAEGDLTPQLHIDRLDEIGALSQALDQMTDKLRDARTMARNRLLRAQRMSDAALEHLYDPVVVLDQKSRIVHLNQAAEDLLGKIPDGSKVPILDHIKDKRLSRALKLASGSGAVSASEEESESIILQSNGARKVFRFRATPMKDDEGILQGSVAVLEDVTHFREVDRLKNEFIGVASHELRTPVSSLLLSAQLLMDGAVGELTPEQREVVEIQLEDLDRLEKLMKDLLDVTKLAAGMTPMHLEKVKISDLVETVVGTMTSQATKHGVTLKAVDGELGIVCVDRSQVGRVLTNLTANAIRHTHDKGIVKVGAVVVNNEVRFFVEDTGEGIPQEYLSRIFDRFVQVPGATQGGAGLGLSIAQNIVKSHHGSMGVESEVGKGSVFYFTLPLDSSVPGREKTV